jgi:urea carboxylase
MKMEIAVKASSDGALAEWLVGEGKPVAAGQHIAIFSATPHNAAQPAADAAPELAP